MHGAILGRAAWIVAIVAASAVDAASLQHVGGDTPAWIGAMLDEQWLLLDPVLGVSMLAGSMLAGWNTLLRRQIARRQRRERALQAAARSAESACRAQSDFLAIASHEIRTPLNAVAGMLELGVRAAAAGQDVQDHLRVAHGAAQGLLDLIRDILDLDKMERGKLQLQPQRANLRALAESVVQVFQALAHGKGLSLRLEAQAEADADVLLDAMRFRQILSNLLSNAVKFTPTGGVTVRVQARRAGALRLAASVQVIDTGIGISEADQQALFAPYAQTPEGARVPGGCGLGLSIARRLAALMGGKLQLQSKPGRGCEVRFDFDVQVLPPQAAPHAAVRGDLHGDLHGSVHEGMHRDLHGSDHEVMHGVAHGDVHGVAHGDVHGDVHGETHRGVHGEAHRRVHAGMHDAVHVAAPLQILTVDDNAPNRLLLRKQLEHLGHRVVQAASEQAAWRLWRPGAYDLVITDCNMAGGSGYALARRLRAAEAAEGTAPCRVWAYTASARADEAERCRAAGMDACLLKPLSLGELQQALAAVAPDAGRRRHAWRQGLRFDPGAVESLAGGDACIADRIMAALQESSAQDARALRGALAIGDREAIDGALHALNGVARMIGAAALADACIAAQDALAHAGLHAGRGGIHAGFEGNHTGYGCVHAARDAVHAARDGVHAGLDGVHAADACRAARRELALLRRSVRAWTGRTRNTPTYAA